MLLAYVNYPNMAKRMGQTGIVELMLTIDTSGKLIDVYVQNSSGHKLLDKNAIKAAKHLAKLQLPVPKSKSNILIPIAFRLN
jgi:periplasmic protein TonB